MVMLLQNHLFLWFRTIFKFDDIAYFVLYVYITADESNARWLSKAIVRVNSNKRKLLVLMSFWHVLFKHSLVINYKRLQTNIIFKF